MVLQQQSVVQNHQKRVTQSMQARLDLTVTPCTIRIALLRMLGVTIGFSTKKSEQVVTTATR
jgi:hypothetical protein